jgi:hypothetical protein
MCFKVQAKERNMKEILNGLNDFWVAFVFLATTVIGYALGGISYMLLGIFVSLMIIRVLYSSNTLRNPEIINRFFGNENNYSRITKGLFYTQGIFIGVVFGWHFSTIFFFS